MSHTAQLLSKTILKLSAVITVGGLAMGCSLVDKKPSAHQQMQQINKQKVYNANYDVVWRAAHAVLKYPIAQENQDTGIIETEYIKAMDGWIAPNIDKQPSAGTRYKLTLMFAKGKTGGKESVRVTIDKKIEILRDFFSPPEALKSDGLEEKIIFYRIDREIKINDSLRKAGY